MEIEQLSRFARFLNSVFAFAAIAYLLAVLTTPASAGCGVNFDKMRKRRIEAIRGQILSKLGMTQLPENVEAPPVPRDIEKLYNQTRDFVLESARQKRVECEEPEEDYYAQEILTANAMLNGNVTQSASMRKYKKQKVKKELSEFFHFDIRTLHLDPDTIMSASLRLYQIQSSGAPNGGRQQVELYQLSPGELENSKPSRHFLTMKLFDRYGQGWANFDVTSTVREWARYSKMNQGIEVTVPCADASRSPGQPAVSSGENNQMLKILFAGSAAYYLQAQSRGDEEDILPPELPDELRPHLVIMVRTASAQAKVQSSGRRRKKRALDADYCFRRNPNEANCCLRRLFIDFRRDLDWKWIHAPSGYYANFCAGACPYLWSMDSQHATILSLYKSMNPRASSSPCCSPKELEPLTIMYYDQGKFRFTQMSDMVLLSCKCS